MLTADLTALFNIKSTVAVDARDARCSSIPRAGRQHPKSALLADTEMGRKFLRSQRLTVSSHQAAGLDWKHALSVIIFLFFYFFFLSSSIIYFFFSSFLHFSFSSDSNFLNIFLLFFIIPLFLPFFFLSLLSSCFSSLPFFLFLPRLLSIF